MNLTQSSRRSLSLSSKKLALEIRKGLSLLALCATILVAHTAAAAQEPSTVRWTATTRSILAIKYVDGKDTSVDMVGTALDPRAKGTAEITLERGRALLKITMSDLGHPQSLGAPYTTFLLWAIAPEGKATNIAELPIGKASTITTTTPFQTFGLIVTAEPHAAVTLPSPVIVAENVWRKGAGAGESRIEYRGDPGTFYVAGSPTMPAVNADLHTPLPVLGARRAVEIARQAGAQRFAEQQLREAETTLAGLERAWPQDKKGRERRYEKQFGGMARDVMRLAEQARALAVERAAEASLQAERAVAQSAIATAQGEAARAKEVADAFRDAMKRAQEETQAARDRSAQAQTDAEKAKANEELARAEAEQARLQAERAAQEKNQAKVGEEVARAQADQARLQAERAAQEKDQAKANEGVARAEAEEARLQAERTAQEKKELEQRLYSSISEILEIRREARGLIVSLSDVLFDFDRATLKPGARDKLNRLTGLLLAYPGRPRIEIEGHTDSIGSDDYNLKLSQARAESVRECLTAAGITPDRITATRGLGKAHPVASNESATGRQLNRRVELVIEDVAQGSSTKGN